MKAISSGRPDSSSVRFGRRLVDHADLSDEMWRTLGVFVAQVGRLRINQVRDQVEGDVRRALAELS